MLVKYDEKKNKEDLYLIRETRRSAYNVDPIWQIIKIANLVLPTRYIPEEDKEDE